MKPNKQFFFIIQLIFIAQLFVVQLFVAQEVIAAKNSLYVFYPTDIRPRQMEKHISRHCPDINTTVFGKIKDFEKLTRQTDPDAVLTLPPVLNKFSNFTNQIQGLKNNQINEDFVLVSINKPVDLAQLGSIRIGVLDILGRKPMKHYINEILGVKVKIVRVTKTEDILNLLSFGLADAIFVSQQRYEKMNSRSQLNLVAKKLGVKMNLAVLAVKENDEKQLFLNCFKHFDRQTNALLGVDKWLGVDQWRIE